MTGAKPDTNSADEDSHSISGFPLGEINATNDVEKGITPDQSTLHTKESQDQAPTETQQGPPKGPPGPTPLPRRQMIIVFIGLFLSVLMASLDQTIIATATPSIVSDLGNLNDLSWIFVAYLLTSTAFMPLYGKMGDIFGRAIVFIFALSTFMLGSLLCGVSVNMTMLIISRAIQGVGGGGLIALVMIVISDIVPVQERGKYQGIIGATFAVSSVIGPLIGGVFVDNLTWRWAFFINLPIGVVCMAVIIYGVKITKVKIEAIKRIDFLGTILVVSAVVCAVLAFSWGGDKYAWDSAVVISLFVLAVVLAVAFTLVEIYVATEPIIQFQLFKLRNVSVAGLGGFFTGYPMFGCISYLPLYFQVVQGSSATTSGLQMLPMMFGVIVGSMGSGIAISKIGRYNFFPMIGMAIATVGMYLLSRLDVDSTLGDQIGYLIPIGLGIGLCLQTFLIAAQSSVDFKYIAVITASINFFRTIGGVFGVAIFGAIFNTENAKVAGSAGQSFSIEAIKNLPPAVKAVVLRHFVDSLSKVFLYAIPVVAVGWVVSLFLQHIPLRSAPAPLKSVDVSKSSGVASPKSTVVAEENPHSGGLANFEM